MSELLRPWNVKEFEVTNGRLIVDIPLVTATIGVCPKSNGLGFSTGGVYASLFDPASLSINDDKWCLWMFGLITPNYFIAGLAYPVRALMFEALNGTVSFQVVLPVNSGVF